MLLDFFDLFAKIPEERRREKRNFELKALSSNMKAYNYNRVENLVLQNNIKLITFNQIFQNIHISILNFVYNYSSKWNSDTKRVYLNCIIQDIHNLHKDNTSGSRIIIVYDNSYINDSYALFNYVDKDKVERFTFKTLSKLSKILPYPILIKNTPIDITNEAELMEFVNELVIISNKFDYKVPHLQKMKDYLRDNGYRKLLEDSSKTENWRGVLYK